MVYCNLKSNLCTLLENRVCGKVLLALPRISIVSWRELVMDCRISEALGDMHEDKLGQDCMVLRNVAVTERQIGTPGREWT